jgi:hypothetical protein
LKLISATYSIIVLTLLFAGSGCSQDRIFDVKHSAVIKINSAPSKVAVRDFNKDGFNDIMVTSDSGLVILLNNGEGGFTQPAGSPYVAGIHPADIVLADFNRDGNIDAAIPNHETDEISMLFGDGKGSFRKSPEFSLHMDFNPHAHSAAADDLNNDKKTDLVATSFLGSELFILYGNGNGTFSAEVNRINVPHYPYRNVIIYDINGDRNPDIITPANNSNAVTILIGNGVGRFIPTEDSPYDIGGNPFFVAVADFNDDGNSDIIASNFDAGTVSVLPGNKNNDFDESALKTFSVGLKPVFIATEDLNKDGITDAVCANYESNNVTVLFGNRKGFFGKESLNIPVGTSPYGAAVGDLNGDGFPDIVTANFESNDITILYNQIR